MVVTQNIYSGDSRHVLVHAGTILDLTAIQRIRRHNNGEIVLVSPEIRKTLIERDIVKSAPSWSHLERQVGYPAAKDEIIEFIELMAITGEAKMELVRNTARNICDKLADVNFDDILNMVNKLNTIGDYLFDHSIEVAFLNGIIGKWLELPESQVDALVLVGLLHDCGKTRVPASVLNAPRNISILEFEAIKMHATYSYEMCQDQNLPVEVQIGVLNHHEKYNGTGYPDNLSGEDIPLTGRITAVSDMYSAIGSHRIHKRARSPFCALANIHKSSGVELDPKVSKIFIDNMSRALVGKPFSMSNGDIALIDRIDYDDLEFPYVILDDDLVKTSKGLYCEGLYLRGLSG